MENKKNNNVPREAKKNKEAIVERRL